MNLKQEHGNVLVYILIVVALFAALGFTVSNMMRSSGGSIAGEKVGISAAEVLDYGKALHDAVQFLRISKGCGEREISFARPPFDETDMDYDNDNAPEDYSCHIFHPSGSGMSYVKGSEDTNGQQDWIFTAANDGDHIGHHCSDDECADLMAILPGVPKSLCQDINKKLGISDDKNNITQEDNSFEIDPFQGEYTYEARLSDNSTQGALEGQALGCVRGNAAPQDADTYYFYQVLLAR